MFITENLTDFEKFILSLPQYKDSNPKYLFKKFTVDNTDIEERAWVGRYMNDTIDLMCIAYHAGVNSQTTHQ